MPIMANFDEFRSGQTVLPDRPILVSKLSFNVQFEMAFSTIFCLIKNDLSGNTVWPL